MSASSPEHSFALLGECQQTLDALPIDLSRNFAELRELDAVLNNFHMSVTAKLTALTQMIEQGQGTHDQRLWLLMDLAEEASRMKHGSDDKIRVASQAADTLKSHSQHLRSLVESIPGFDPTALNWRTTYPHVATRSFMPPTLPETRRRRQGFASLLAPEPTPLKRKRGAKDEDQSPKKVADGAPRGRGGRKKIERPPSPTESVVSITSHMPPTRPSMTSRASSSTVAKRTTRPVRGASGQPDYYDQPNAGPSRLPPSSAHPSLAYQQHPNGNGHATPFDLRHTQGTPAPDWVPPHAAQMLEGPGMPISVPTHAVAPPSSGGGPGDAPNANSTDAGGDGEADGDDTLYCFCQRVSFGQMIACDDSNCQWEWFHIACIGLQEPPDGRWFCESCKGKRGGKRPGRGGRRKGGGRAAR
ncbi:hypothetical protein FB45DRAFT_760875 [Roridomyces roridus]|uniref:Chromatin modification-related protein n=1 Tax=Roridomyces roridus TaxID=1738132 RepID=A0AAD7F9N5_9AGAR|nr:hypothetical protein FB45DRAFT_760875 [Roridomyces roridus]